MGSATAKLDQLRPVKFRYKNEPQGPQQYGLIAEEVANVYPELVLRDAKGHALSVRYDELAPMLLSIVQEQQKKLAAQDHRADAQASETRQLKAAVVALQAAQCND